MPVNDTHPEYSQWQDAWRDCRAVIAGGRAVKQAGSRYLMLTAESQNEMDFRLYKKRALFYNATARTLAAMTGAILRKQPRVVPSVFPQTGPSHWEDIDLAEVPLQAFCRDIVNEVLAVGRAGVLVDYPGVRRVEDPDGPGWDLPPEPDRPYWTGYGAEDIVNWRTARVGGDSRMTMLVLREAETVPHPRDRFRLEQRDRFRELFLDEAGVYRINLWEEDGGTFRIVREVLPKRRGQPLDFIPFTFFGPTSLGPDVEKPPLLDLVDVNLSHYNSSADLEHARHWTALPTLVLTGWPDDAEIRIGSSQALVTSNENADAKFVSLNGTGLEELREALKEKAAMMAAIGSRLLDVPRMGVEAAEAIRLRTAGEQASLQAISHTLSDGLTRCLRHHLWWAGASEEDLRQARIDLNDDFVDQAMDPRELRELVLAQQAGLISRETFLYNLKRGEVLPPGRSPEEELELIRAEGFALGE